MHRRTLGRTAAAAIAVAAALALSTVPAHAQDAQVPEPAEFTSTLMAMLSPDEVVNDDGSPSPGQAGASGTMSLRINSQLDIVCYDIMIMGVTPPFQSNARTAVHLQEGAPGESGNPRLVFPDPQGPETGPFTATGCLQGPFTTGVIVDDVDTGTGFTLAQLEANPPAWFVDAHTSTFPVGALRAQLMPAAA